MAALFSPGVDFIVHEGTFHMRRVRFSLKAAVVLTAALSFLLASVRVSARPIVFRTSFPGGDIPSIDPSLVEEPYGIQLVDELTVGLLRMNEETLRSEEHTSELQSR